MEKTRPGRKKWIIRAAILAAAAALVILALLLLAGGRGLTARFDNADEILADYDSASFPTLSLDPDGTAVLRLARNDLYYFARSAGVLDTLREALAQRGCTGVGLRLADGSAMVYARCRTLGFLPLIYRARVSMTWQDGQLVFTPEKVWLGSALSLSENRRPELFRSELRVDPGPVAESVLGAAVRADALEVRLSGLGEPLTGQLRTESTLLCAAGIYGVAAAEDEGAAALLASAPEGMIPMDAAEALLRSSQNVPETLTCLLAGCTPESVETLWPELEVNYRRSLLARVRQAAGERRAAVESALAAEQTKYEKLLTAVRESYKSGSLAIGETGFVNALTGEPVTAGALTALSASDTDSRIVLLCTLRGSREICLADMPALDDVPRRSRKVDESRFSAADVYDLGVVLTSEGNVPLLLHRHRDGSFLLRVLSDTAYVSALVERGIPVLCVDDFPVPSRVVRRSAGEGWNGAQLLLLK